MKELKHLSEVFKSYDTFVIDLWGVMHNGVTLNSKAIEVVDFLYKNSKKIVFLSNAPRPSSKVINFLLKMNLDKKYLLNVMTSGEAAIDAINQNKFGKTFFHLGPPRDTSLFEKQKNNKTEIEKCDFILCTGLFDNHEDDLSYYKNFLKEHISIIDPKIIILFGSTAMESVISSNERISNERGKWKEIILKNKTYPLIVTFSPSYLIRFPDKKKYSWEDLKKIRQKMKDLSIKI